MEWGTWPNPLTVSVQAGSVHGPPENVRLGSTQSWLVAPVGTA